MENSFLKEKYGLHKSSEVEKAAKRTERRTGKKFSLNTAEDAEARIENYLERLQNIINPSQLEGHEGFDRKQRNLEMLKHALHEHFVVKPEEIPEAYFESIKRRHREEGYGDIEIPDKFRQELSDTLIVEQRDSLDEWVDYLASEDAKYPNDLKYWAFRSILKMGRYDKEREKFAARYGGAVSPFPELNQEALSLVFEAMEKKRKGEAYEFGYDISADVKKQFLEALQGGNFAKLYGLAVQEFNPIAEELLKVTEGTWVTYPKGSDPMKLVASLKRRGTGWCIAGEPTARRYLQGDNGAGGNDLEVFYSLDKEGNPTIPRIVIVSQDNRISEVRGVAKHENTDSYIDDVVQKKLRELHDGKSYEKKSRDMKRLTAIERKMKSNEQLTRDDLIFLYEMDSLIEHFGYRPKDPRIEELRSRRNPEEDMPVVLECSKNQIAHSVSEIEEGTKAYVGPLMPGIFDKIQERNIEYIYTSFPEGRIRKETLEIGGKDAKKLIKEMREKKININDYAMDLLKSKEFAVLEETESAILIRLKVKDLGIKKQYSTTDDIYNRIKELGLELCPPEVGPHYRLKYQNQPLNELLFIGMKQIAVRDGAPGVFRLVRGADGLWLDDRWAYPTDGWNPGAGLVFRFRKKN